MRIVDEYLEDLKGTIDRIPVDCVDNIISILHSARINHKHVFIMGNGGSASTASHFVCDLAKNTRKSGWPEFRVIGLTDNMAIFSAYANDEGYENVFAQQLNNLLNPGDVVIAISGSGNSQNVIKAVELANNRGAITVGFTGMTGGILKGLAQHGIYVQNDHIDEVEDIHLMLEHAICRVLMDRDAFEVIKPEPEIILLDERAEHAQDSDELVKELFGNVMPFIKQSETMGRTYETSSELLSKISREFASKLDLHDLLSRILCLTVDYVGAVGGSVIVLNEDGDVIDGALAYAGQIQEKSADQLNETIHRGLAGWVFENRQPALVTSTKEDPRWLPRNWEASLDMTRSAICVPLITQDRVIGILTLTRLQSHRFTMEDLSLLTSITLALSYSFTSKAAMNYPK
jgi:D-sedoheptulose 7-phosphate isomerase